MYISISQEMVRFKIINEPYGGIFENTSVSICPVPQALSSWFPNSKCMVLVIGS